QLGGQIAWLLPLAAFGLLAAALQERRAWPLGRRHQALLLWSVWLLPQLVFFSVANLFHRYYLVMLAPAIAALVGVGVVALWTGFRAGPGRGWLLIPALVGCAVVEARILSDFSEWQARLTLPVLVVVTLTAVLLADL